MADPRGTKAWLPMDLLMAEPSEVSWFAKCLYARLRRYGWKTGEAFPAVATLAAEMHISEDTVMRATRQLESAGFVTVTPRDGLTNLYEFPRDANEDEDASPAPRPSKPKKTPKPKPAPKSAQPELPGVPPPPPPPPRERSRELKAYDHFVGCRQGRLGELYALESKPPDAAFITVVFSSAYAVLGEDPALVADLIEEYFAEEWPAAYGPYSFSCFAKHWREKWLPKVKSAVAA